jgi:homoserine kinase type II
VKKREKRWLTHTLTTLDLPSSLPKGICYCDYPFSDVFFQDDEFVALLDFDDANYTYLQFDLVGLIKYWAWPHTVDRIDLARAREVVQAYMRHRPLPLIEQQHLYDVYKLSILFDCVWFFTRGSTDDFLRKTENRYLNGYR